MLKLRAEVSIGRTRWVPNNGVCIFACIILIAGVWVLCRSVIEGVDPGLRVAKIVWAILCV